MELKKFLRVNGVLPYYFNFYSNCKGLGIPCITIQKVNKFFHVIIDHNSIGLSKVKNKTVELSYLFTEYITKLDEVINLQAGSDYNYIEFIVTKNEEEIAVSLFDDYLRVLEIEI